MYINEMESKLMNVRTSEESINKLIYGEFHLKNLSEALVMVGELRKQLASYYLENN